MDGRPVRLALCQRILPAFRVPVWRRLAASPGIHLRVFHGRGLGSGSSAGASDAAGLDARRLATIPLATRGRYRVLHPGLLPAVLSGGFDVVLCEGLTYFPNSLALALACRIAGIPFLLYEVPPTGAPSPARRLLSGTYLRLADGVVTYNSRAAAFYRDRGVPDERITVARNTVDTELVAERLRAFAGGRQTLLRELGLEGRLVVGFLGGMEERKRPDLVLDAVLELVRGGVPASALFIGDGPMRPRLEAVAPPEAAGAAVFVGRHDTDAERYLQLCSILVLPSQGGLAVPHALTCGIPCIATEEAEGPGIRDYVEDGTNGFVLPSAPDPGRLAALLRTLAADPGRLAALARGALEGRDRFSVGGMVASIAGAAERAARSPRAADR